MNVIQCNNGCGVKVCLRRCPLKPAIDFGNTTCTGSMPEDSCEFSCKEGFVSSSNALRCNNRGEWEDANTLTVLGLYLLTNSGLNSFAC
jgi:hypothetical protein